MEIICINFLNPNQGTYQVPTMKRGGSKILRTKSNKRVLNEPEPRAINIDGSKLKLARAELEIDCVDQDLHESAWKRYLCDIPVDWDRATGTFVFHAEQTSRNVFKSFVEDINRCSTHMVSLSTMVLGSLRHKHDACLAYRAEWQNLLSVLQEWGVSPYNRSLL